MKKLRGIELRYVLTMHLARHGPATIAELVDALAFHGFAADEPADKSVSDALRWERGRGRVRRLERGVYGPGACRAAPSTGFISVCWRCGPRQFAQRRAHRLRSRTAVTLTRDGRPFWLMATVHGMVVGDPPKTVGHRAIG